MKLHPLFSLILCSSVFFVSCKNTEHSPNYGYVADEFNEASIYNLLSEFDRCFNELDKNTLRSLFSSHFIYTEASDRSFIRLSKYDYMRLIEDDFRGSKYINQESSVNAISFNQQSASATVMVQEVFESSLVGKDKRIISLFEYEIGYEDGWIYILSAKRTDKQEVSGDIGF